MTDLSMNLTRIDKTAMNYWLPRLLAARLPVPRTHSWEMPPDAAACVWAGFDGDAGTPEQQQAFTTFLTDFGAIIREVGLPCFIRTGHSSGKHNWSETCYLTSADPVVLGAQVRNIAEYSELAGMMGLPWSEWYARKLLPTIKYGVCPRFGGMPVAREFRVFVDGPEVVCIHPYWPECALIQGGWQPAADAWPKTIPDAMEALSAISRNDEFMLRRLASRAGTACGGAWSVDLCECDGHVWYITDMAEADKSFHWEGCQHAGRFGH